MSDIEWFPQVSLFKPNPSKIGTTKIFAFSGSETRQGEFDIERIKCNALPCLYDSYFFNCEGGVEHFSIQLKG